MDEKPLIKKFSLDDYEQNIKTYNDKYEYYSSAFDKLNKLKNIIEKFNKEKLETYKIKSEELNFTSSIDDNYMKIILFIKDKISITINGCINVINEILKNLNNTKEIIKHNNKNFTDYLNIQNSFNIKLSELESLQEKYYNSAEKAESYTFSFLNKKVHGQKTDLSEFEKKNKLQNICKEEKEKYISKLEEINNDKIKIFNEKQKFIFNINNEIIKTCYENFINSLFAFYQLTNEETENLEKRDEVKEMIIKTTNKKEEISKIEYQEKEKIDFIQYSSRINFNDCYDTMEMGTFISACDEMCKVIGDYIQDKLDHWKELTDFNITINRILKLDEQITEKEEKNIDDILKTKVGENIFINCLSQLRTTGYYEKSKNFIEFIGRTLNIILDSEKNKLDYQIIKSCLILSQTFYYLDLNNEKKYIFEYLSNNKWLKSPNFWRNFIEKMLNIELNKSNSIRFNISELLFTQLIPYIKNMKDFDIDERIIIKIIDEKLKKFDYIENKKYTNLFVFINNDQKEIEKLRKEYQDNPNLEKELYKEDLEEKIDESKNDDKKDDKNNINIENENKKENNENKIENENTEKNEIINKIEIVKEKDNNNDNINKKE